MYAILSHGGRQYRVSAGDRLVVDRLDAEVGSIVALEPVLLTGGDGSTSLGADVAGMRVAALVVGHPRGEKLRIFKYKAKKRYRRVAGYRSDLTELRVDSILAKGAALPAAAAASGSGGAGTRTRSRSVTTPAAAAHPAVATVPAEATTDKVADAAPLKRRTPRAAAAAAGEAGSEAPARTPRAAVTPKPATRPRKPAKDKESGDGA